MMRGLRKIAKSVNVPSAIDAAIERYCRIPEHMFHDALRTNRRRRRRRRSRHLRHSNADEINAFSSFEFGKNQ